MESKECRKCRTEKSLSDFHLSSSAKDGRASWCKKCTNSICREKRKKTYSKENKRKWQLKTRYGLTPEQVEEMLNKQGGKCAICPADLTKFHIDHCHNSGNVRGLLCHRCNIRLGGWDDIDWRNRAIQYLRLNYNAPLAEAA